MFNAIIPNFYPALPEIVLGFLCLTGLLISAFKKNEAQKFLFWFAKVSLILCLILTLLKSNNPQITFNGFFKSDSFSKTLQVLILTSSILCLIFARASSFAEEILNAEYPVLFMFGTLGMILAVVGNDLMSVFSALELLSLSLYIFVALRRNSLESNEAALKYFILGAFSTGIFLYGISFVYGFTGTTNLETLGRLLKSDFYNSIQLNSSITLGLVFIIASLAFKASLSPFHMWTPDVYQGTSNSIIMFLASSAKIAVFGVFIRILFTSFNVFLTQWYPILVILSILSMAFGSISALIQKNLKRLLAYSSIGHIGFIMASICVGNEYGIRSGILYITIYTLSFLIMMGSLSYLNIIGVKINNLHDLKGIGKTFPEISFIIGFSLFSMAGIPPLPGFLGKMFVIQSTVYYNAYSLTIATILYIVLSAAYYLMILKILFFNEMSNSIIKKPKILLENRKILFILYVLTAVSILIFVYPNHIIHYASKAATSLLFDR